MDLNTIHLGDPVILSSKNRVVAYSFIIDKFKVKLNSYKANGLSYAGRLTPIKYDFLHLCPFITYLLFF